MADVPVSMTFNPALYRVPVAAFKVWFLLNVVAARLLVPDSVRKRFWQVPLILPGVAYDHELLVHSIDPLGAAEPLQVRRSLTRRTGVSSNLTGLAAGVCVCAGALVCARHLGAAEDAD